MAEYLNIMDLPAGSRFTMLNTTVTDDDLGTSRIVERVEMTTTRQIKFRNGQWMRFCVDASIDLGRGFRAGWVPGKSRIEESRAETAKRRQKA